MRAMSSTPLIVRVACPYCHHQVDVENFGRQICSDCGTEFVVDVSAEAYPAPGHRVPDEEIDAARAEDEQAAERDHTYDRRASAIDGATKVLTTLLPALLERISPSQPGVPVAGHIDCKGCADWLAGVRDADHQLAAHQESDHAWWPSDLDAVLGDMQKVHARMGRGLRNVEYTKRTLVGDPYETVHRDLASLLVDGQQPDTTGTPPNSPERLSAVLQREGPSPLYDPTTDDLEPAVRVVPDDGLGSFLDGGGDAAPAPAEAEQPVPIG
jgi:hypothetical protein